MNSTPNITITNTSASTPATTIPLSQKYMLTMGEASVYFSIGPKKLRRIAEDHVGEFAVYNGNRHLIIRHKFEEFLERSSAM